MEGKGGKPDFFFTFEGMESYPGPLQNATKYGTIAGLSLFFVFVLFNAIGMQSSGWQQFVSMSLMLFFMAFGTIQYRKNWRGNTLSYGGALWSSTLIAFCCSFFLGFFVYLYILFFQEEFMRTMFVQMEQNLVDQGKSESEIEQVMTMSREFFTPLSIAVLSLLTNTFIAFLAASVMSLFLKRDAKDFDQFIKGQA